MSHLLIQIEGLGAPMETTMLKHLYFPSRRSVKYLPNVSYNIGNRKEKNDLANPQVIKCHLQTKQNPK